MTSAGPSENGGRADPLIGALLGGKYRVISELARGGMGKIYRAEQVPLGRAVALKVLRSRYTDEDPESNETFRKRFLLEASILAKVQHANIVTLYDYGLIEGTESDYFMALELLRGETLQHRLREKGVFSSLETIHLSIQIARGLREAHKLGVVHRDLKPANIMLDRDDDGGEVVKILDFGIGKLVRSESEELTEEGMFLGSPKYMSPEQVHEDRPVGPGADLYALGIIMFECLVGSVPFTGGSTTMSLLKAHCEQPVPSMASRNPDVTVPGPLEALVRRMLEKEAENRPASASDVIRALKDIELDLSGETRSLSRPKPPASDLEDLDLGTEGRGSLARSGVGSPTNTSARERPYWLIGTLVLTLVGVVLISARFGRRNDAESTAVPPASPAPLAEARTFELAITSQPEGAEVLEGDVVRGKTPLQLVIDRDSVRKEPRRFTLRMTGYAPHSFSQQDSTADAWVNVPLLAAAPALSASVSASASANAFPNASPNQGAAETKPTSIPPRPPAPSAASTPTAPNPDLQIKLKR